MKNKNQEKETPLMKATTKLVGGVIVLAVLLPVVVHWLSQALLPVVVLIVVGLIARMVWFHTRL